MKVISLFSGCGGLDLGFQQAGFDIVYANDNSKVVWETYEKNLGHAVDPRSLFDVPSEEIPAADGIIGGPPCQSWSLAGAMRGAKDERGLLFFEYVRVIKDKRPKFFLAENVPGILSRTHIGEFKNLIKFFEALGYTVYYQVVDMRNYGVPQERRRVIIIGFQEGYGHDFEYPAPLYTKGGINQKPAWATLKEAIGDLPRAKKAKKKNQSNGSLDIPNHEYMHGTFSSIYMSRNRKRNWDEQSFTIQAGGRHAPLHPSSSNMYKVETDKWAFQGKRPRFRRLSVRECARIQTFPDDFIFYYTKIGDGYKMVGNAVPVKFAEIIALKILSVLNPQAEIPYDLSSEQRSLIRYMK